MDMELDKVLSKCTNLYRHLFLLQQSSDVLNITNFNANYMLSNVHTSYSSTTLALPTLLLSHSQLAELRRRHPFIDGILNTPLPLGWKPLNIDQYDKTTDPDEHLEAYITQDDVVTTINIKSEKVNKDNKKTQTPQGAVRGVINTITGGFTCGGCMKSARNVTFEHSKVSMPYKLRKHHADIYQPLCL
ncbi:hypothetical protein JHK87_055836 [Glycine soja]|nr:hypothetical protein JHK87_055836 [Glycine soja]